jgi:hypothetical protein
MDGVSTRLWCRKKIQISIDEAAQGLFARRKIGMEVSAFYSTSADDFDVKDNMSDVYIFLV